MTKTQISAVRIAALALVLALGLMLLAGRPAALAGPDHDDWAYPWSSLPADLPLAGHSAMLADARMLLLGGEAEFGQPGRARALDLGEPMAWSDLEGEGQVPVSRQPGRGLIGARAILDADDDRLLLVCDCEGDQTYLLDLASGEWTALTSETELALWYPSLVYDAEADRAILFGGDLYGTNSLSSEVWSLDLSSEPGDWVALPSAPFALLHQALAVDSTGGHLLAFGGQDENGVSMADLWRVDLSAIDEPAAWERVPMPVDAVAPQARIGAAMAFAPEQAAAFLYGGYQAEENGARDLGDLWRLDYDDPERPSWELLAEEADGPGLRAGHSAVWDASNARMLVYGGTRGEGGGVRYLDDAWQMRVEAMPQGTTLFLPLAFNRSSADGR